MDEYLDAYKRVIENPAEVWDIKIRPEWKGYVTTDWSTIKTEEDRAVTLLNYLFGIKDHAYFHLEPSSQGLMAKIKEIIQKDYTTNPQPLIDWLKRTKGIDFSLRAHHHVWYHRSCNFGLRYYGDEESSYLLPIGDYHGPGPIPSIREEKEEWKKQYQALKTLIDELKTIRDIKRITLMPGDAVGIRPTYTKP